MLNLRETFRFNERVTGIAGHAIVAAMMYCASISVMQVVQRLLPGWQGGYLPWLCLIVSLEAMYTQHRIRRPTELERSVLAYRAIEIVVILIGIKAFFYLWRGVDQLWIDLPLWRENFIENFFEAEYLFAIMVTLVIWIISGQFAEDLVNLEGDEILLTSESLEGLVSNRGGTRAQLSTRVLSIGAVMVILTALVRLDYQVLWGKRPVVEASSVNVIVYFFLGLALLSLTQFAAQRAAWAWERIPINREIAQRWILYSLIFLLGVSLIALILPTEYSLGFLPTISYLISLVLTILYALMMILLLPLMLLLSLFSRLFRTNTASSSTPIDFERIVPSIEPITVGSSAWWEFLKSLVFWGVFLGVIVYAIYQYLHQNQELLLKLRRMRGITWMVQLWRWIMERIRIGAEKIPNLVQAGLERVRAGQRRGLGRGGWRFVNPRNLAPRQRVLFYYLALVRRGSDVGIPRQPSQTPSEYAHTLSADIPQLNEDIDSLTESFLEARYSQHEVTEGQASVVRRYWDRIRRAIREWERR